MNWTEVEEGGRRGEPRPGGRGGRRESEPLRRRTGEFHGALQLMERLRGSARKESTRASAGHPRSESES